MPRRFWSYGLVAPGFFIEQKTYRAGCVHFVFGLYAAFRERTPSVIGRAVGGIQWKEQTKGVWHGIIDGRSKADAVLAHHGSETRGTDGHPGYQDRHGEMRGEPCPVFFRADE